LRCPCPLPLSPEVYRVWAAASCDELVSPGREPRWKRDAAQSGTFLLERQPMTAKTDFSGPSMPGRPPFRIRKIGHVVLRARDLERSVAFYTQVLGFRVSDVYPEEMMPGGMVFMRCNADHHGIALVGGMPAASTGSELHHMAF